MPTEDDFPCCRKGQHDELEHRRQVRLLESQFRVARLMSYGPLKDES